MYILLGGKEIGAKSMEKENQPTKIPEFKVTSGPTNVYTRVNRSSRFGFMLTYKVLL